jgi:hypothetical protein
LATGTASIPAAKIATVARIFSYLGWPFFVFFGGMAALGTVLAPIPLFIKSDENLPWCVFLVGAPVFWAMAFLARLYLKTARRLRSRDPNAVTTTKILLIPMVFGFPIFTIAAIYCFALLSYYPQYLAEAGLPESNSVAEG